MRAIAEKTIRAYAQQHRRAGNSLRHWLRVVRKVRWQSLDDVRNDFPSADPVRVGSGWTVTVFNVAGNSYRLVAAIHYNTGVLYVLRFLTHAEYDRDIWKDSL